MLNFIFPKLSISIERWKWNSRYEIYVSSQGRFKDKKKKDINIKINQSGYCVVKTALGYHYAHRLVLMTYMPIIGMNRLTIDHLDHNKRKNSLKNLQWVTFKENQERAKNDFISNKEMIKEKNKPTNKISITTLINQTINDIKNYSRPISNGSQIFKNTAEAACFYIKKQKMNIENPQILEKRILSAIIRKKKYLNSKWNFVEEI